MTVSQEFSFESQKYIELRADGFSLPSPEMRDAMYRAEVGNDGFGEDPSVNKLEEMSAEIFQKESATFVSSGSMGNLISVLAYCKESDSAIIGNNSHTYNREFNRDQSQKQSLPQILGIQPQAVKTDRRGMLDVEEINGFITHVISDRKPRVMIVENTHNLAGGKVLNINDMDTLHNVVTKSNIPIHLDGARIFNASIALDISPEKLTEKTDSVLFCLSKGLGAPVGSLVVGSQDFISEVKEWKKILSGSMKQAGVIAAAGIVALKNYETSIRNDHQLAKYLEKRLLELEKVRVEPVETNLVYLELDVDDPFKISEKLKQKRINAGPYHSDKRWRLVPHYGLTKNDIDYFIDTLYTLIN